LKFRNSSFTVKKSEDLAPVRVHKRRKGHASDSRLTEETEEMDGEGRVAAWLILRANVFAGVVEIPV
jgi:hypothetical protein